MLVFNLELFAESLAWEPPRSQWGNYGMNDFSAGEQAIVADFIARTEATDLNLESLVLAKGDMMRGEIVAVYGPALFRSESGAPVLVMGNNEIPVEVVKATDCLKVGQLTGELILMPRDDGKSLLKAIFSDSTGYEVEVSVRVADVENYPTRATLKAAIAAGTVAELFAVHAAASTGRGESIGVTLSKDFPSFKSSELFAGLRYPVTGITRFPGDPDAAEDYKQEPSYLLTIADQCSVWLNGSTMGGRQLSARWPNIPLPVTAQASETGAGKISVRFVQGVETNAVHGSVDKLLGKAPEPQPVATLPAAVDVPSESVDPWRDAAIAVKQADKSEDVDALVRAINAARPLATTAERVTWLEPFNQKALADIPF